MAISEKSRFEPTLTEKDIERFSDENGDVCPNPLCGHNMMQYRSSGHINEYHVECDICGCTFDTDYTCSTLSNYSRLKPMRLVQFEITEVDFILGEDVEGKDGSVKKLIDALEGMKLTLNKVGSTKASKIDLESMEDISVFEDTRWHNLGKPYFALFNALSNLINSQLESKGFYNAGISLDLEDCADTGAYVMVESNFHTGYTALLLSPSIVEM
ncbi:hypothetical protein AB4571_18635 [Vibrio breoganii]|uniref:hypothetical protein n=1 Tax=Vibrio breoganii TaxID=553239 RepID=UPI000C836879|nr:hypothetical protein [Vibrio breoganii]PML13809.1 hypothetical protein BCT84_12515 [Vibrio breoganii]